MVRINDTLAIGGKEIVVMAGPCSVESEQQIIESALAVKAAGAQILRGGAFKPRTSPYSFQGLEEEGLKLLAKAREMTGLPFVTEVIDPETAELVADYADMLQIGARNAQNFALLKKVGQTQQAGPAQARHVDDHPGVPDERRIHHERGEPGGDPLRARHPHLRDRHPQHPRPLRHPGAEGEDPPAGDRRPVPWHRQLPLCRSRCRFAAVAAGADGLIIEVHPDPERASSDGPQSLKPKKFAVMMAKLRLMAEAAERSL